MIKILFAFVVLAPLVSKAEITEFQDGMPFAREGFGVRRNFYMSGRRSAKVADIGYATLRIGERGERRVAVASLVQKDFYLRAPVARKERKLVWDLRIEENRGRTCTFAI